MSMNEPHGTRPAPAKLARIEGELRWFVRLEQVRSSMFGEHPRESMRWAVFPYVDRDANRNPIPVARSNHFTTRSHALEYAAKRAHETRVRTVRLAAHMVDGGHV